MFINKKWSNFFSMKRKIIRLYFRIINYHMIYYSSSQNYIWIRMDQEHVINSYSLSYIKIFNVYMNIVLNKCNENKYK